MTNKEALQAKVEYPVSDNALIVALTNHGINPGETYSGNSQSFDLAQADILYIIVTSPQISDEGYHISPTEKQLIKNMADAIYVNYGVRSPFIPIVKNISNRS